MQVPGLFETDLCFKRKSVTLVILLWLGLLFFIDPRPLARPVSRSGVFSKSTLCLRGSLRAHLSAFLTHSASKVATLAWT